MSNVMYLLLIILLQTWNNDSAEAAHQKTKCDLYKIADSRIPNTSVKIKSILIKKSHESNIPVYYKVFDDSNLLFGVYESKDQPEDSFAGFYSHWQDNNGEVWDPLVETKYSLPNFFLLVKYTGESKLLANCY